MDQQKDMANIFGQMDVILKAILNKAIEMGMEYGNLREEFNNIKAIIYQIENTGLVFTLGLMVQFIKVNIFKTFAQDKDNYIKMESLFIQVNGKMGKGLMAT